MIYEIIYKEVTQGNGDKESFHDTSTTHAAEGYIDKNM